jgi:hypothetical protein
MRPTPGALAWCIAIAIAFAACSDVPTPAPVGTSPSPAVDALAEVAEARRALGLATNPVLLRALTDDPAAIERGREAGYDFPLTEAEVSMLEARARDTGEVSVAVKHYGADHPEAWAGSYLDSRLGLVIARFTGDLEVHESALATIVHRDARLRIEPANWTLRELEALSEQAWTDRAWFETVDALLVGNGVDIVGNAVLLDVESDRADIVGLVHARFGGSDKVTVRLVPAAWTGERGTLIVFVRDAQGRPVAGLDCELVPDDPRAAVEEVFVTDDDGSCTFRRAPAMGVTVVLSSTLVDPPTEVARVEATVGANAVTRVAVRVDPTP